MEFPGTEGKRDEGERERTKDLFENDLETWTEVVLGWVYLPFVKSVFASKFTQQTIIFKVIFQEIRWSLVGLFQN